MNRRDACLALAGAGAGAVGALATPGTLAALHGLPGRRAARPALLISGAAAMLPLMTALARAFPRERGAPAIVIEHGGSLPAYIAASRGAIDLAAMTRALSDGEDDAAARHYLIARDHLGVIVHRASPVAQLSRAQVRALLTGEIANWRALGGPDRPVTVYAQRRGSAPRQAAEQLLLDGADFAADARECADATALAAAVAADPAAIGYLAGSAQAGAGAMAGQVAAPAIDGVRATLASVLSGRYPYTHGFHLLSHGAAGDERDAFVQFARGGAGQAVVASLGLLAVC